MKINRRRFGWFPKGGFRAVRLEEGLLMGDEKAVYELLERGGEEAARQGHLLQPLLAAIQPMDEEKTDGIRERLVGHLLMAGADPNASCEGLTPLLLAATHGTSAIVRALLGAGAEVGTTDYQGRSAMHRAAAANQPADLVVSLVQAGIAIDVEDLIGSPTPLAMYERHHNREACLALLAAGADPMMHSDRSGPTMIGAASPDESPTQIQRLELDLQVAEAEFVVRHPSPHEQMPPRPPAGRE